MSYTATPHCASGAPAGPPPAPPPYCYGGGSSAQDILHYNGGSSADSSPESNLVLAGAQWAASLAAQDAASKK